MRRSGFAAWVRLGLGVLLATGLLAGCGNNGSRQKDANQVSNARTTAYQESDVDRKLTHAMNRFGLDLYAEWTASQEIVQSNVMLSPAGLGMALSMLRAGAEGETAEEMDRVLGLKAFDAEQLDAGQHILRELMLAADPSVRIEIANSLWAREGFQLKPSLVERLEQNYEAQARALDFNSESAADTMNEWAALHTNGKIDQVIDPPIDPNTVLFLMNALYFKGSWMTPFDPALTKEQPFATDKGQSVQVPTMSQTGRYAYADEEDFQAIRLPYGTSGNFAMIAAVPDKGTTLESFKNEHLADFSIWSARLAEQEGQVELPKFKLEDSMSLNDVLKSLGMESAFDPHEAEFGGLAKEAAGLYVSEVSQDTFIEVNEEGTEAAAVTVVAMNESASPSDRPFEMKLNRPFFFAITDRTTGLILFMGEVGNPAES
ncbi:serpin family protein [Saccharibacillus endophyticus]|uniref:Serine protease inhibitor n=1 Tax=Saccharibacillus endophyticus TaxID=2060666 RepID=A0ABQ1ZRY6_9BACL|nr:serpin family protein [Saccharibacillus endophyticus]GGH72834.1 serine protease inhibitor [Saccharibacillus endophyticus]